MAVRFSVFSLPRLFTRALFRQKAAPLPVRFDGALLGQAKPREYATGSLGWRLDTKAQVALGEGKDRVVVWVQVSFLATVMGTKTLPKDPPDQPGGTAA